MATAKQLARQRKKERKAIGLVDGIKPDVLEEYMLTRCICERCGLEQHDATRDDYTPSHLKDEYGVTLCTMCGHDTGFTPERYKRL